MVAFVEAGALAFLGWRERAKRSAAGTAVARGRRFAEQSGCFGCHGDGGGRPIANPGSRSGEVPSWTGGTWMMWNRSEADVREWIVRGRPAHRLPDEGALLSMPAYGRHLSSGEIDDLVAYFLAVAQFGWPADPAVAEGREVATRLGCFGCHGPEGRGLVANPGSFKGYVPPWDGPDYPELVRDDAEFGQWVRNGITDRFRSNPAARHFLDSQAIPMPAYGDRVSDEDLAALRTYVAWVRAHPRGSDVK